VTTSPLPRREDVPALVVRSRPLDLADELTALLPDEETPVAWVRNGEGLVGWGVAARVSTAGPGRFRDAQAWWDAICRAAHVRDEVGVPGSGLVCLGSFAFADRPGDSTLLVPRVLVGRRGRDCWLTTVTVTEDVTDISADVRIDAHPPAHPAGEAVYADGALSGAEWQGRVAEAVAHIEAGEVEKVVLARDLIAELGEPLDVRRPIARLARRYPSCWTFHVEGLFGATPEMLVRRERGLVTSRVLAGTIRRTGDDDHDSRLAGSLARSSKDLEEHEYAVRSVAEALEPYCSSLTYPEAPFVLHLPNVMHLATDVAGVVDPGDTGDTDVSSLALAAALHPSAAVGGTPTAAALDLISRLEGMTRGRYAGPVGWMDATGDGEWGIALRSAQVGEDGRSVRLFAGCGIVAGSDPDAELAESQAKLVPVRDALG
jgi:menaquinone-specific isochorismate synthase